MSRRQVQGSRKAATQTALERLRQQRAGDRSALRAGSDDERDDDEDVAVFDEMDEADYQLLMRKRLQEDDFVVDDDGLGYVDYGDGGDDVGASGSSRRRRGGDDDDGSSASSSEEEEGAKKSRHWRCLRSCMTSRLTYDFAHCFFTRACALLHAL